MDFIGRYEVHELLWRLGLLATTGAGIKVSCYCNWRQRDPEEEAAFYLRWRRNSVGGGRWETYFGSGGPSARGFMESLQSERNTRKASFCRMWEKRAALWGPCRASASCHTESASSAGSGRRSNAQSGHTGDVLRRDGPLPYQHVCGGDRRAVFYDAVHLLRLCPDSGERHCRLLGGHVRLVACQGERKFRSKGEDMNETPKMESRGGGGLQFLSCISDYIFLSLLY